jgi:hypothetical protein
VGVGCPIAYNIVMSLSFFLLFVKIAFFYHCHDDKQMVRPWEQDEDDTDSDDEVMNSFPSIEEHLDSIDYDLSDELFHLKDSLYDDLFFVKDIKDYLPVLLREFGDEVECQSIHRPVRSPAS